MSEQRYQAVLAVIAEGSTVVEASQSSRSEPRVRYCRAQQDGAELGIVAAEEEEAFAQAAPCQGKLRSPG